MNLFVYGVFILLSFPPSCLPQSKVLKASVGGLGCASPVKGSLGIEFPLCWNVLSAFPKPTHLQGLLPPPLPPVPRELPTRPQVPEDPQLPEGQAGSRMNTLSCETGLPIVHLEDGEQAPRPWAMSSSGEAGHFFGI